MVDSVASRGACRLRNADRIVVQTRPMKAFTNFVNGEYVDAADGRDDRRSSTRRPGQEYADGAAVAARPTSTRRWRRPPTAFDGVARRHAARAVAGAVPHRRRGRGARRRADRARGREHRQADRTSPASEEIPPMVDQIRFFAGAARHLEGKSAGEYMAGHDVVHPPRAGRRVRPGRAVELPDDDGGLEVRPGDRRRQHRGAQAERHDAGDRRRCWPRSPPSSSRRACST